MKKILFLFVLIAATWCAKAQTTYYWVGGASSASINAGANWNTALNGSGSSRPSSSGATDILVFDGTNLGGATPVTGPIIVHANAGITCAQVKFVNGVTASFVRNTTGTTTITIAGEAGDDFIIAAGCNVSITSTTGSIVFAMAAANTGTVSGNFSMITPLQARIANTTSGSPGSLIFTAGSTFTTNITAASAAYAFGNSSQSSEKWVIFQAGSHLYYDGGFSPFASNSTFMPVDFQPGSVWHHRVSNPTSGFGVFSNNKSFANLSIENGATFTADGAINRIDTLTVTSGSNFITPTSGATTVKGNMIIDGTFTTPTTRNNTLVLAGTVPQTISGSGTMSVASLTVADNSDVTLNRNIAGLDTAINIYGKINFNNNQLTGTGTFTSHTNASVTGITGTLTSGNAQINAVVGTLPNILGLTVTGTGIPANTVVVNYSNSAATITLSKPATASGTAVVLSFSSDTALLATSNTNGFDPASGSVAVTGIQTYQPGTSYIINAATTKPFGITTGSTATYIDAGTVTINAAVTTNASAHIYGNFQLNSGKVTLRPLDTVHVLAGATLTGNFSSSNYFATGVNTTTGAQGILRVDGISASKLLPVGTASHYMPVTINPVSSSDFTAAVFEGITDNGLPNGTALSTTQKLTKVDAVWNINRVNGTGSADLQIQWAQPLEGSTFTTLTNSDIGIIVNNGSSWALPITPGDNTTNTANANFSSFGAFGVGAQPPAQAFTFNPLPAKTYGDPDFNGGAISANTTQPIVYTSSNPAVATIVGGNIHIVGVGNSDITASQATDGFYPAVSVTQSLTVNKAPLTIKADDKAKPQGDPNPVLTVTYTGFVLGETAAVLTTPVTITTTATTSSPPGTYPITVSAATANNYNITFVNGTMTVTPRQNQTITFNALPTKTYGNSDFAAGATSSNTTIPITYSSSNTAVATIIGNNIHIVGAGTTTITASQAGNAFYFPAADVTRTLTVNKANLTIRALDTSKITGQPNPPFALVYTGFVLGENSSALQTAPTPTTTATTTTPPGVYPITVEGGISTNYNLNYVAGKFTIYPATGTTVPYIQAYMSSPVVLTVKLYSPVADLGDIIVFDISGKVVLKKNVFMPQGFLSYTFDVLVPASGIYVVKAIGKNIELKTSIPIIK